MKSNFLKVLAISGTLLLNSCTSDDTTTIQENNINNLVFTPVYQFNSNQLEGPIFGMTGDAVTNNLFIASRDDFPLVVGENREQIIKIDMNTQIVTEKIFENSDFISKWLFIKDNRLICLGGNFVNSYDLNLTEDPISINHGKYLSHSGVVAHNNDIYIIGGELLNGANKVYTWDYNNPQVFNEFAVLTEDKYGAGGFIVDNELYVLEGSINATLTNGASTNYIISLDDPTNIQEFSLGIIGHLMFVEKYQNSILIAAKTTSFNGNGDHMTDTILGLFDPVTQTFEQIPFTLANPNGQYEIGEMHIMNDTLYILYGYNDNDYPNGSQNSEWKLYSASLN